MIEEIYAFEDEDGVEIHWPVPEYQRVCAQGHLVTDLFNSYEVPRGKDGFSYACKRCQLEANKRQKEKKQGTVAGEPFEEIPDTPEHRAEIWAEHAPGPDETPQDLPPSLLALQAQLDRIERKVESIIADRPNVATRVFTERIRSLEEQLAEAKKGPGLDEMTFDQLKAKAAELGIEIPKGLRSAGARKLIQEYLAGQPSTEDVEDAAQAAAGDPDVLAEADHVEVVSTEPDQDGIVDAEVIEDNDPEVALQHEGIVEADSDEEVLASPRRRRRPKTDEELNAESEAAMERARAKTAARKAAWLGGDDAEADEDPAPRRRRRPRRDDAEG